ncbi:MAG: carboxypeptidase regulatory-like domain-containing protein [Bacteroidaceae bacterium]|nr:carboxypeptidase regulatory-like domain-containing protein [Bacteroidaceae bacterium]
MKEKCFQLLCFLLCLTAIGACEEDPEVLTGNIMGKVTDAATGNVMQGVSVTITPGGLSRTTGTDGYFEFLELEPKQYEIQARKTDYVTNHKTVYVVTGRDASGDIQLTPEVKEAKLALSVSSLNFGKDNTSLSFDIINEGEINFNWNISGLDKIDWLEVNPTSGRLAAGKSNAVQVSLLRDRITENKEATILINADKESVALKITAEAEKKESKITINPHSLHFGEDYSSLTFEIKNDGNVGDEDWNITSIDADWIKVSPITGTTAIGKSSTVKVELDREKLPAGAQTTTILVNYNGGSQRITINATGEERTAKITLSQNTLDFGMEATSLTFDIKNVGNAGDISWEISGINAEWLKVTPTTGTTSMDKSSAVKVEVDREKMAEGKQTTTFLVNAYGESFPITVNAEKEVKVAKITLSQNTLDFGMEATSLTFDIKNVGNAGDINWEISGINTEWLKVTPTTGTTSMDKSSAVKVEVDREKMAEGKQTTTFLVNAYGESFPITVNAEKEIKVAKITLSQNSLDFGLEATSLTFDIKNVGNAGDISWEISGVDVSWVKVFPMTGTTSMERSSAVKVEVDREKMSEGKNSTTILVNAYGASFPITIHAEKKPARYIEVIPTAIAMGTDDSAILTLMSHNGATAYELFADGDYSWASFSKTEGVIPEYSSTSANSLENITINANRTGLTVGTYSFTLIIRSDLGDTRVPVSMTVEEAQIPGGGNVEIISSFDDLEYTLTSCTMSGTTATLEMKVKNIGTTTKRLILYGGGSNSYAYDDQGYKYENANLKLAFSNGALTHYNCNTDIPAGVMTKMTIKIYNIYDEAAVLANIRINTNFGNSNGELMLKNVELEGRTATALPTQQTTGTVVTCDDNLEFTLIDCKAGANHTTLSFYAKNIGRTTGRFILYGGGSNSYAYDDEGNKYENANLKVSFANYSLTHYNCNTDIPSGVMVKCTIQISNVDANATEFSNITIKTNFSNKNGELVFKNVKIRK